jgi:hypothetical protein
MSHSSCPGCSTVRNPNVAMAPIGCRPLFPCLSGEGGDRTRSGRPRAPASNRAGTPSLPSLSRLVCGGRGDRTHTRLRRGPFSRRCGTPAMPGPPGWFRPGSNRRARCFTPALFQLSYGTSVGGSGRSRTCSAETGRLQRLGLSEAQPTRERSATYAFAQPLVRDELRYENRRSAMRTNVGATNRRRRALFSSHGESRLRPTLCLCERWFVELHDPCPWRAAPASASVAGGVPYPGRDSNPHPAALEAAASASWATGAWYPRAESNRQPSGPEPDASASWATRAWYSGWDSNPQRPGPRPDASANWATGARRCAAPRTERLRKLG